MKYRVPTFKMEVQAYSSRGWNRPHMAQSMKMIMFHKDWFRHSGVNRGKDTHRQQGDLISVLLFF
jgi:hypothetical protein